MSDILGWVGKGIEFAAKNILGPVIGVCGLYTLILYILSKLIPIKSVKVRKVLQAISKPPLMVFRFLGGLPEFKIIIFGAAGAGALALIGVFVSGFPFQGLNAFVLSLFMVVLVAGGMAFGLFCVLLACKGFAAALGYVYASLGDFDTYVDTVKDIGGKFIVYADEDPDLYPEDLITLSSETRAEAEARHQRETAERNRVYKAEREAHRRYLDARNRFTSASYHYRTELARGATQDALRYKAEMEQALIDMNRSGYSG